MSRLYSAIILKIVYGVHINSMDHDYVKTSEEAVESLSVAQVPGKFWVEFLPFLRYIPPWVPGAHFKKWAERCTPVVNRMVDQAFESVKQSMVFN